jgi:hypothetical protein
VPMIVPFTAPKYDPIPTPNPQQGR